MSVLGSLYRLPAQFFQSASVSSSATDAPEIYAQTSGTDVESLASAIQKVAVTPPPTIQPAVTQWNESGATCMACGIGIAGAGFASAAEQRAHFKSDWHRFNVKRRVTRLPAVSEEQFAAMLDQHESEVSSISGSDVSTSDESSDDANGSHGPVGRQPRARAPQAAGTPQAMFTAQGGQAFCVWRCLLERDHVRSHTEAASPAQLLCELQRLRASQGVFVVILLRGGHFAAAVFKARTKAAAATPAPGLGQSSASTNLADVFETVAHKTFHRYVVRAKAGGKQSAHDGGGKFARSAGAALRRYNEAALDQDISALLAAWRVHLDAADLIFVQAPSSNARSILAGAESQQVPILPSDASAGTSLVAAGAGSSGALLSASNHKLRRIPFATQRPTFGEARRVVGLLLSVFEPSAGVLAAQQAAEEAAHAAAAQKEARRLARDQQRLAAKSAASGQRPSPAAQPPEQQSGAHPAPAGCAAGAGEPGGEGLDSGGAAAARQPELQESELHAASRAGDVSALMQLLQAGADPCLRDSRGRTPYAVAASKEVRDTFRRYMAQEPDQWDYAAAGLPSALTDDLEAAQRAKKAEKKARQKAKDAERKAQTEEQKAQAAAAAKAEMEEEVARAAAEAAAIASRLTGSQRQASSRKVGAGRGRGAPAPVSQPAPLTPEQAAKRREQLAAAAEARMAALQQAAAQQRLY